MAGSGRKFNEKVRERIFGLSNSYSSSSSTSTSSSESQHEAYYNDTVSASPCLSDLVQNFLEETAVATTTTSHNDAVDHSDSDTTSDEDDDDDDSRRVSSPSSSDPPSPSIIREILLTSHAADPIRRDLHHHATTAIASPFLRRSSSGNKLAFTRLLTSYLRTLGYDAAVCKTKWKASAGGTLTAGSHTFVDVVVPRTNARYIVEPDFVGEFDIACGTERYGVVLGLLPAVFVGRVEEMRRVVRVLADEMRRSMRCRGIFLPPWRKHRYLQAKWFGQYRRTVSSQVGGVSEEAKAVTAAKCRAVGFFDGEMMGGGVAVTRTR